MASIGQIRGALLEEIVLFLLSKTGYRIVVEGEEGTRTGRAGLELRGRGEWHQIDALATPVYSLPFMYPLRLMIEAKCYDGSRKVDIRIIRSAIGTALDVNQSYYVHANVELKQFNYHPAVFSANGYSKEAQRLAAAHQVFLIDYADVPTMRPVIQSLLALTEGDFATRAERVTAIRLSTLRRYFREQLLRETEIGDVGAPIDGHLKTLLEVSGRIRGTYYGMIQGAYPVHFVSPVPISPELLIQEEIPVRLRVLDEGRQWYFEPSGYPMESPQYFRLDFQLPTVIAEILSERVRANREVQARWQTLVEVKQQYLSYVDLGGMVGNRFAFVRLTLDQDWLAQYVEVRRNQQGRGDDR